MHKTSHYLTKCFAAVLLYFFSDNDVDGDTVDFGLTETMVGQLFQGSFKKQLKFMQFVSERKNPEPVITLETVPPEEHQLSASTSDIPRYVHCTVQ